MAGYGDIPQLPNPFETASSAILAAIKKMPQLTDLTAKLGKASAAGAAAQIGANLPGYADMLSKDVSNVEAALGGEIQPDVKANIWQAGQERGIGRGLGLDSPNIGASYLRMMGLTSRDQEALGHKQMGELIGWTPTGPAIDPTKLMPDWADLQQMLAMQAIYNAAPDPTAGTDEGRGRGGYSIAPTLPSPTFAGATRSPTWSDFTAGRTFGATGVGGATMYPGYHWDPGVGDYVKDEYKPVTGNLLGWTGTESARGYGTPGTFFGTPEEYDRRVQDETMNQMQTEYDYAMNQLGLSAEEASSLLGDLYG